MQKKMVRNGHIIWNIKLFVKEVWNISKSSRYIIIVVKKSVLAYYLTLKKKIPVDFRNLIILIKILKAVKFEMLRLQRHQSIA